MKSTKMRIFEIPTNRQGIMVLLIEAIPNNWRSVTGWLDVPRHLVDSGQAEKNTGFLLDRDQQIRPNIIDKEYGRCDIFSNVNLFAIMVQRKFPGFVRFNYAGEGSPNHVRADFQEAVRIAKGFIRLGYRGALSFRGSDPYEIDSENCQLIFIPFSGTIRDSGENGPPQARIYYRSCEKESKSDMELFIQKCE